MNLCDIRNAMPFDFLPRNENFTEARDRVAVAREIRLLTTNPFHYLKVFVKVKDV